MSKNIGGRCPGQHGLLYPPNHNKIEAFKEGDLYESQ